MELTRKQESLIRSLYTRHGRRKAECCVCEGVRAAGELFMLNSLACVDATVVFDGQRCDRELAELAADLYVKGGDYTLDKLDPAERAALEAAGTQICFKPFIPGFSTSTLVERILRAKGC